MKKIVLLTILLLIVANTCFAETRQIYAQGTYIMGDGETPVISQEKSMTEAMRNAMEQSGVYLESYSQMVNLQMTKDEVNMISAGVIQVVSSNTRRELIGNSLTFTTDINCNVRLEEISVLRDRLKQLSINKTKNAFDINTYKWEPISKTVGDITITFEPTLDRIVGVNKTGGTVLSISGIILRSQSSWDGMSQLTSDDLRMLEILGLQPDLLKYRYPKNK